jgi:hypothetical protein
MRKRVYISGPITGGDRNWNQYQANVAQRALLKAGYATFNPMPTGVLPFAWDGSVEHAEWLDSDFAWIAVSDMLVRLPGVSIGGDMETEYAKQLGIPVFVPEDFPCLQGLLPQWETT